MIKTKYYIGLFISVILLSASALMGQNPTMSFDGRKLSVNVPSGHLEFVKKTITNDPIRNCFEWGGRDTCLFMSNSEPYVLHPIGLSTNDKVSVPGLFNGEQITINVEMMPQMERLKPGNQFKGSGSKRNIFYIIGSAALLLLIGIFFFVVKRRRNRPVVKPETNDPNVLNMINDESIVYEKGLQHVYNHLNEYLAFDMDMVFTDTAVNKVYFSAALIKKLYDFFNNSLEDGGRTNETGCFILGCWDHEQGNPNRYNISLEYMVEPGDDADFGEYSLNFGKKIGINTASIINTLATKSKRDYVLTCWMHSHPGLGLFLSNQDLIVQRQLTYPDHPKRLIAIVIDTNTPEFKVGFFTAKADGKMNNQEEVKRWFSFEEIYRQSREMNRNGYQANDLLEEFKANPDYFNLALNGEGLHHIGFAGHAINQVDNALFSNVKGVIGYLFGEEENGYIQVGCCLPYENDEKRGCLINDDDLTEASLQKYASELNGCQFLVSCKTDNELDIWTRNSSGSFAKTGSTTMTQMKEWIRRKRV